MMQKLTKIYRKDYRGEDVIIDRIYKNSEWNPRAEFVPKTFNFIPEQPRAVVIGNGTSRLDFDLRMFLEYREGNFQNWKPASIKRTFYTYGCNAIFRDYVTDFIAITGEGLLDEFVSTVQRQEVIAYANNQFLYKHPSKFSLIPQNPNLNSGAIASYLAAFDGHSQIYMLGFDGNDTPNYNYNVYANTSYYPTLYENVQEDFWVKSLSTIMKVYNDTEFVRVMPTSSSRIPEPWKYFTNFRQVNFNQFASEIGL
jgi:hypothetical protein